MGLVIDQCHELKIMSLSKETINVYIKKHRKCILHLRATLKRELLFGVIQNCNETLKPGEWREFRAPRKERMGGCWMNAFHIILVGCWCDCLEDLSCVVRAFLTFSEVESMTKPSTDKGAEETWLIIDRRWPELVLFFISTDEGRCVFPPVSCFIQKDHYQLCLAEINWITTTWVDVFSFHPAPR